MTIPGCADRAPRRRKERRALSHHRARQLHFDYAITASSGPHSARVHDGRQTFVEFPPVPVGEAPPLFLVDGKGQAQLVNYRLQGRFYVVDRLFDAAELRLGLKHQDVVRIERASAKARKGKRS